MKKTSEWYATYRRSKKGKRTIKRYESSAKAKERKKRYWASEKGKAVDKARRTKRKKESREVIITAKSVPCADCGNSFPVRCMDFHHLRDKKSNVGWGKLSINQLHKEISKCVVLCANCHRLRHA